MGYLTAEQQRASAERPAEAERRVAAADRLLNELRAPDRKRERQGAEAEAEARAAALAYQRFAAYEATRRRDWVALQLGLPAGAITQEFADAFVAGYHGNRVEPVTTSPFARESPDAETSAAPPARRTDEAPPDVP